jgi:hypothetical protein
LNLLYLYLLDNSFVYLSNLCLFSLFRYHVFKKKQVQVQQECSTSSSSSINDYAMNPSEDYEEKLNVKVND